MAVRDLQNYSCHLTIPIGCLCRFIQLSELHKCTWMFSNGRGFLHLEMCLESKAMNRSKHFQISDVNLLTQRRQDSSSAEDHKVGQMAWLMLLAVSWHTRSFSAPSCGDTKRRVLWKRCIRCRWGQTRYGAWLVDARQQNQTQPAGTLKEAKTHKEGAGFCGRQYLAAGKLVSSVMIPPKKNTYPDVRMNHPLLGCIRRQENPFWSLNSLSEFSKMLIVQLRKGGIQWAAHV